MFNYGRMSTLEIVEEWGYYNDLLSSEEEVSERFDAEIAPAVVAKYGEDDTIAMNEAFNNWTDSLCKDGELHELQYENYEYVGRWA